MSGSFKNKLLRFETPPPPGTWDRIAARLDNEYAASDARLSERLEAIEIAPPAGTWKHLASLLNPVSPAKIILLFYKRIAVAVIFAAVAAVTAMYLFTAGTGRQAEADVSAATPLFKIVPAASQVHSPPSPAREIKGKPAAAKLPDVYAKSIANQSPLEDDLASMQENEGASEAYFSDMRTVPALQRVSIPARPILDAEGCVIMDINLISNPVDPYITVTGPNGSQTRISNKFLTWLSYLNSEISADNTNNDGIHWKEKFQTWRVKLLNDDSFVPAASNFFDIFEMKDMIQE